MLLVSDRGNAVGVSERVGLGAAMSFAAGVAALLQRTESDHSLHVAPDAEFADLADSGEAFKVLCSAA